MSILRQPLRTAENVPMEVHDGTWVLNSLWRQHNEERCKVNILDTIILNNGEMRRWLFTSRAGDVMKKRAIDPDALRVRFIGAGPPRPDDKETLCAYSRSHGGRSNLLSRADVTRILKTSAARQGLQALQLYLPPKAGKIPSIYTNDYTVGDETGHAVLTTVKRIEWTKNKKDTFDKGEKNGALLPQTNPIVRVTNGPLLKQLNTFTTRIVRAIQGVQKCRVLYLKCEYTVDAAEMIWLSWVSQVKIVHGKYARDLREVFNASGRESFASISPRRGPRPARCLEIKMPSDTRHIRSSMAEKELEMFGDTLETNLDLLRPSNVNIIDSKINEEDDALTKIDGNSKQMSNKALNARNIKSFRDKLVNNNANTDMKLCRDRSLSNKSNTSGNSSTFPTPFKCEGDFCDFAVSDGPGLNEPGTATEDRSKRLNDVLSLLSKDELDQIRSLPRFEHLFNIDNISPPSSSQTGRNATSRRKKQQLFKVNYKSIISARGENRSQILARDAKVRKSELDQQKIDRREELNRLVSGDSESISSNPNGKNTPKTRNIKVPGFMKHTQTRKNQVSWSTQHGEAGGGVGATNFYRTANVCSCCYGVYRILDRAREVIKADKLHPGSGVSIVNSEYTQHKKVKNARKSVQKIQNSTVPESSTGASISNDSESLNYDVIDSELEDKKEEEKLRVRRRMNLNDFGDLDSHLRGKPLQNTPTKRNRGRNRKRHQNQGKMDRKSKRGPKSEAEKKMDKLNALPKGEGETYIGRILLVDHEDKSRNRVKRFLKEKYFDVDTCRTGNKAIEMTRTTPYDAILVEIDLPDIPGYQCCKLIRGREAHESRSRMPVVAFTHKLAQEDLRLYMDVGMDGCVSKPVDRRSLLDTMLQAVPQHNPVAPKSVAEVRTGDFEIDHSKMSKTTRTAKNKIDQDHLQVKHEMTVATMKAKHQGSSSRKSNNTLAARATEIIHGRYQFDPDTELPYAVIKWGRAKAEVPLYNIVLVHDFFDNLENAEIFFKPLVQAYPGLRVLVFNYPGQAYTTWKRGQLLNNQFLAGVLSGLLQYVDGIGEFSTTDRPFYLTGFGNGASIVSYYGVHYHNPNIRSLVLLNGFAHIDQHLAGVLHDCINVFSCCPATRPDLPVYFYTRFIFSGRYLTQVSTPLALNLYTAVHNPISLEGRIALCQGALGSVDIRKDIENLKMPLLLAQSEMNGLVRPVHVEPFVAARGGECQSIHTCLKRRKRACVIWFKSGHELFQEARKPLSALFEQLASGYHESNNVPVAHLGFIPQTDKFSPKEDEQDRIRTGYSGAGSSQLETSRTLQGSSNPHVDNLVPEATMEDSFIDNILHNVNSAQTLAQQEASAHRELALKRETEARRAEEHHANLQEQLRHSYQQEVHGGGDSHKGKWREKHKMKEKPNYGGPNITASGVSADYSADHPAFERQMNSIYKPNEGSKIYPTEVPEMKEYMQWRLARNRKRLNFLTSAAGTIQRSWRSFMARTMVVRMRRQKATLLVQRMFRGHKGREHAEARRMKIWAAKFIQCNWRGMIGRRIFEQRKKELWAATFLQRIYRGHLGVMTTTAIKVARHRNATFLQKWWRGRLGRRQGWTMRRERNASINIQRIYRGYSGRMRAEGERDKYLFSKSQAVGIEFGRQMLVEHKLHATKLQSEVALLLQTKAETEESVEKLLYELSEFEHGVQNLEKEMHELSKIEVETEAKLTEKQRIEIRENKMRLDKEFGEMLQKIARHREFLKEREALLQRIDRDKQIKENALRDLERKLVVLLEEQQKELTLIRERQLVNGEKMLEDAMVDPAVIAATKENNALVKAEKTVGARGRAAQAVGIRGGDTGVYQGPTPAQKQQASNLMQSTETMMKFGFMSMSLTYFSSLNMIKAMRAVGAVDTIMAGAHAAKAQYGLAAGPGGRGLGPSDPRLADGARAGGWRPKLKPGQLPGEEELNVAEWSIDDVGRWLETLTLRQYQDCFEDAAIDGSFLYDLNEEDLRNTLGIEHKLHRKKILNSIRRLKKREKTLIQEKQARLALKKLGRSPAEKDIPGGYASLPGVDDIDSDSDTAEANAEAEDRMKAMTLDQESLFSWVRHRKLDKIKEAFAAFPEERFNTERLKYQFVKDFGTQYTDEYNFNRHVNFSDAKGNTMFLIACQNGTQKIAEFLLSRGANPNHQNNQGQTALHYAMTYGFFDLGSWLADAENGAGANDGLLNMFGLGSYDGLTPDG